MHTLVNVSIALEPSVSSWVHSTAQSWLFASLKNTYLSPFNIHSNHNPTNTTLTKRALVTKQLSKMERSERKQINYPHDLKCILIITMLMT
jgi:hypothetical protein